LKELDEVPEIDVAHAPIHFNELS